MHCTYIQVPEGKPLVLGWWLAWPISGDTIRWTHRSTGISLRTHGHVPWLPWMGHRSVRRVKVCISLQVFPPSSNWKWRLRLGWVSWVSLHKGGSHSVPMYFGHAKAHVSTISWSKWLFAEGIWEAQCMWAKYNSSSGWNLIQNVYLCTNHTLLTELAYMWYTRFVYSYPSKAPKLHGIRWSYSNSAVVSKWWPWILQGPIVGRWRNIVIFWWMTQ